MLVGGCRLFGSLLNLPSLVREAKSMRCPGTKINLTRFKDTKKASSFKTLLYLEDDNETGVLEAPLSDSHCVMWSHTIPSPDLLNLSHVVPIYSSTPQSRTEELSDNLGRMTKLLQSGRRHKRKSNAASPF